jgi:hypothetical protein
MQGLGPSGCSQAHLSHASVLQAQRKVFPRTLLRQRAQIRVRRKVTVQHGWCTASRSDCLRALALGSRYSDGTAGDGSFASIYAPCPIRESVVRSWRIESVFNSLMAPFGRHGFPITIAIAAATNGNGSDTAARNHEADPHETECHKIMRWKRTAPRRRHRRSPATSRRQFSMPSCQTKTPGLRPGSCNSSSTRSAAKGLRTCRPIQRALCADGRGRYTGSESSQVHRPHRKPFCCRTACRDIRLARSSCW